MQCGDHAVRLADVRLKSGRCLTLTGANGVGKTSVLRALAGLRHADEMRLLWDGRAVEPPDPEWAERITYVGHATAMQESLTAAENLCFYAALKGRRVSLDDAAIGEALSRFGMREYAERRCARLSAGRMRRLSLCRLPLEGGVLWLLDEPATALDANARADLEACVVEHLEAGGMAVVATHQALNFGERASELGLDDAVVCGSD